MPFDLQPVLKGDLLELRPLRPEDHDALYAVARDPLIWEQHPAKERATPEGFRRFFDESLASGGALLATDARTGEVIGSSRFFGHDEARGEIEIGWTFLARSCWGGVYNGEMKRLMLRHAFRFVNSVVFLIAPANFRSQRAVEKIGAVRDGSRRTGDGRESWLFRIHALQPSPETSSSRRNRKE
jgi:RimJ/RimL family protein N-acetyltransferase